MTSPKNVLMPGRPAEPAEITHKPEKAKRAGLVDLVRHSGVRQLSRPT